MELDTFIIGALSATQNKVLVANAASLIVGSFKTLGSEIVKVTAISGNILTILRAQLGTSASTHAPGESMTPASESPSSTAAILASVVSGGGDGATRASLGLAEDDDVTFASVSGDGSGLTGLPAGATRDSLGLDTDDDVTFASVSGDGSGLTNLPGGGIADGTVLNDSGAALSVDPNNRVLKDAAGATAVDFQSRFCQKANGNVVFDFENGFIYDPSSAGAVLIALSNYRFYDGNGTANANVCFKAVTRELWAGGAAVVTWAATSLTFGTGYVLKYTGNKNVMDIANGILYDRASTPIKSIDYALRRLFDTDGTTIVLDWASGTPGTVDATDNGSLVLLSDALTAITELRAQVSQMRAILQTYGIVLPD